MGCDIHQRTFVLSKVTKKYVALGEIEDYSGNFKIVGDRYYDLFGLFGNTTRSNYPAMDCLNFGIPDELLPRTARASFKHYGIDYHTHSWAFLEDLVPGLAKYLDLLKNPGKFIVNYPECFSEKWFELPEWKDDTTSLIGTVEKMHNSLKWILEDSDYYSKIIDVRKTLFLFYFDN